MDKSPLLNTESFPATSDVVKFYVNKALGFNLLNTNDKRLKSLVKSGFLTEDGSCLFCPSKEGIELWVYRNKEKELLESHFHFNGGSKTSINLFAKHSLDQHPVNCMYIGYISDDIEDRKAGSSSNFAAFGIGSTFFAITKPQLSDVQITAYAVEKLQIENDEKTFSQNSPKITTENGKVKIIGDKLPLGPKSYIPHGHFGANAITPTAELTGVVEKTKRIKNSITGSDFYWMQISTFGGGTIDVVADPSDLETVPKVGNVIRGMFVLCAQFDKKIKKKFSIDYRYLILSVTFFLLWLALSRLT